MKISAFIVLFITANLLLSQSRILIDDDFSDWQNIPPAYTDANGDNGFSNIDFGRLWIHNDVDYLFFNIEVGTEINLQDANEITIYIDTDNNISTGISINGIGADLTYSFGNRSGMVYVENNSLVVFHNDIQFISAPTVTSDQFELVISRDLTFFGQSLFQGNTIQVVFKDNSGNWDILPDESGGVEYSYTNEIPDPLPEYSIQKPDQSQLRVLSYNVKQDGLFDFVRAPSMSRLIETIAPEIIGFQEIYDHNSLEVANTIESILPSGADEQWFHAKKGPDIIAISRYPIINSYSIDNNGAFLLNLESVNGGELLFIVAHTPCCGNNQDRQMEIDAIMAFIRNAKDGIGALQLEENTPIIVVGDMNLVGFQQQLTTLLTGDIVNENIYGPAFDPDWDESDLDDSRPYITGLPNNFTWFNEGSSFSPGRLDFIIYTGSVLELTNNYNLFTRTLPQDTLNTYNLLQEDAIIASDHTPVVSDFNLENLTGFKNITNNSSAGFRLEQNEPNPFNSVTTIKYQLPKNSFVTLSVYDVIGLKVAELVNEFQFAGAYAYDFKAAHLNEGIYFLKIKAGGYSSTVKMMVLK
jgi:exonuclease III